MREPQSQNHVQWMHARTIRNLYNLALIVSILFLVLAPFVLILSYIVTAALTEMATAGSQILAFFASNHGSAGSGTHGGLTWHNDSYLPDQTLILRMMPWTVEFVTATMAILLWGLSTTTTAHLLARMGARPARTDGPGGEAIRSLLRLSLVAGIAPPKLYIVQCRFPTAFSDATDIRHTMVALTTGMLDLLEDRELEALLAHELSHIANRDGRLEAMLAALAALTEYPSRMFHQKSVDLGGRVSFTRNLALLEVLLSPLSLYVFFVSPVLNALIRTMVLRSREFHADTEAALLTSDPESLATALGKIGGVVTVLGVSTVSSLPSHISISQRIERLMHDYAGCGFSGLGPAIATGKQYARERPGMRQEQAGLAGSSGDLGEVSGRVYQIVSNELTPLFDGSGAGALVRKRIEPGGLLVVYDAPGKMRQVNTAEELFGYISRKVKLRAVEGVLPQEVYQPETRAAIEEALRLEATVTPRTNTAARLIGLTSRQLWIALGFGTAVFAGTTALLFVLATH